MLMMTERVSAGRTVALHPTMRFLPPLAIVSEMDRTRPTKQAADIRAFSKERARRAQCCKDTNRLMTELIRVPK